MLENYFDIEAIQEESQFISMLSQTNGYLPDLYNQNNLNFIVDSNKDKLNEFANQIRLLDGNKDEIKSLEDKNGFMDKSGCSCSAYRNFIFSSSFDLIHLKDHDSFNGNFINEYKSNYHT